MTPFQGQGPPPAPGGATAPIPTRRKKPQQTQPIIIQPPQPPMPPQPPIQQLQPGSPKEKLLLLEAGDTDCLLINRVKPENAHQGSYHLPDELKDFRTKIPAAT